MARASTYTWLSLDRWAAIVGINPLHFNGLLTTLSPDTACDGQDVWFQYAWQNNNRVGREDLAEAIREAEKIIANYVGYNLLPDWVVDERHNTVRPAIRELYASGWNARNTSKSIITAMPPYRHGYAISGGQRAKVVIQSAAAIVRSDVDGDGYQETCTVTVTTTYGIDDIRVYFPGYSGDDAYEIRPIAVSKSGNTATITFKIWQAVLPTLLERFSTDPTAIDGDNAANFSTTTDVYRVYNDPQSPAQLLWESDGFGRCGCGSSECATCTLAVQNGCIHIREPRLGTFAYGAGNWNSSTEVFDNAAYSVERDPDRLRLWYYSGWRDEKLARPANDLDSFWEKTIVHLSIALLDRRVCACNNVEHFIDYYQEDLARNGSQVSYQNVEAMLGNNFGTRRGGYYAWQRCNQEGRRIA